MQTKSTISLLLRWRKAPQCPTLSHEQTLLSNRERFTYKMSATMPESSQSSQSTSASQEKTN